MSLVSTPPVTEMSIRKLLGGGGGEWQRVRKTDNLTAICEPTV
jgi:hypothetical protein